MTGLRAARGGLVWAGAGTAIAAVGVEAATSPLLAWRDAVYVAGCFAGVAALALLLVQPLLAGGYLPRLGRRAHRWVGGALVGAVVAHVAALWLTSPPDVVDALLFRSPTAFSAWGVVAMWAVFATALLAALRRWQPLWRLGHLGLGVVIGVATVVHAWLIDGTMGTVSKAVLCALVLAATAKVVLDARVPAALRRLARRGRRPV